MEFGEGGGFYDTKKNIKNLFSGILQYQKLKIYSQGTLQYNTKNTKFILNISKKKIKYKNFKKSFK